MTPDIPASVQRREHILRRIQRERDEQEHLWEGQVHPNVDTSIASWFPTAGAARELIANCRPEQVTWTHILVEEMAEAVEAASHGDDPALIGELVQVAAVAIAWIEDLPLDDDPRDDPVGDHEHHKLWISRERQNAKAVRLKHTLFEVTEMIRDVVERYDEGIADPAEMIDELRQGIDRAEDL